MSDFRKFANALHERLTTMSQGELYVVGDALDRDSAWLTYLAAFPEGTNPLFRERTTHDCSTCRSFIKNFGCTVAIVDGEVFTIWGDPNFRLILDDEYAVVAEAMDEFVKSLPISGIFRVSERQYGTAVSHALIDDRAETFNHFWGKVADRHFTREVGTERGAFESTVQVFRRGLETLSLSSLNMVVDLIDNKSLYRGEEHLRAVTGFRSMLNRYNQAANKNAFVYANAGSPAARFRNTVIGTLVQDLSDGVDLEAAVRSFESKVAPMNYKRPKAIITANMIADAMKTIEELGIESSLERRFARLSDVSVNDVLWVNNDTAPQMKDGGIRDVLMQAATSRPLSKNAQPEQVSIATFMKDILPDASAVELLVKNTHEHNFVSLTTGANPGSPGIFKWGNDFAWSYGGNVTDSIKEKVKRAGGSVTGKLRVSLSWFNYDDLDIHIHDPRGNHLYYGNRMGVLDVDMNAGGERTREPVENMSWDRPTNGDYRVVVNQYSRRETDNVGFVIEVESDGKLEHYSYDRAVIGDVEVGMMTVHNGVVTQFKPGKDIQGGSLSKTVWGVSTEQFVPVNVVTYSPNFWSDEAVGNRHYIFALRGCVNDQPTRGLYNEHLRGDLDKHRKVFEILGDRTKVAPSDEQLSGLGFSSTGGASVTAKVTMSGGRQRLVSIQF